MAGGRLRDLGIRTASAALVGLAVLGALLYGGQWGVAVLVAVIGTLAATELYRLVRRDRRMPNEIFGLAAVAIMPFAAVVFGSSGLTATVSGLIIAAFFWHIMIRPVRVVDTATTVFGAVYVGFTLSHLVLITKLADGVDLALVMVFGIWANDVLAYLVGSSVGKHPLAPRISPKKSWEGLIGGTIGTMAVWAIGPDLLGIPLPMTWRIGIGAAASLAAVIGDLAESRIKREVAVKDSGTLLPGHGGFLDRFDSFTIVTICTFYLLLAAGIR